MSGVVRYPTCPRPRVEEHGIIYAPHVVQAASENRNRVLHVLPPNVLTKNITALPTPALER